MSFSSVATTFKEGVELLSKVREGNWRLPQNMLMVTPDHFRIDYAINPYMKDESGQLKVVDHQRAKQQWNDLMSTFDSLGVNISTIAGDPALPDMVFAANQSFVFWNNNEPNVVMSRMRSPERRAEVKYFEEWYRRQGYRVHHIETPEVVFEGNGDALLDPKYRLVWGGTGPRTSPAAYQEIAARFDLPVILLPLRCSDFYHLDTCFSILGPDAVALQSRAFDSDTLKIIKGRFATVIEIEYEENIKFFAGNCHMPRDQNVVLNRGAVKFTNDLERHGFKVHEVNTSEFMKSGGSVFCMKMMVF